MAEIRILSGTFLKKTGDTMFGNLNMDSLANVVFNNSGTNNVGNPVTPLGKLFVDEVYLGGTLINPTGINISAINIGAGIGIFAQQVNSELQFKSLVPGNGIMLSNFVDSISIELTQDVTITSLAVSGITITGSSGIIKSVGGVLTGDSTTSDLPEGTNLYYTDTRARAVVSGTSPISAVDGLIGISTSSAVSDGSLSSIDWNIFNNKQPSGNYVENNGNVTISGVLNVPVLSGTIISGNSIFDSGNRVVTSVNSKNGPSITLTTTDIAEGTHLYYTDERVGAVISGTVVNVSGISPIIATSGVISILSGSSIQNGYISSGDWNTFKSKQNSLGYIPVNVSGDTILGTLTLTNGVNLLNNVSGINNIGNASNTFGSIYVENIISKAVQLKNVVIVRKDSTIGQFSSISTAIASISGESPTNPYVVYVNPGIYDEPAITVPSYIHVVGIDQISVIVQPIGNNSLFTLATNSSLSFMNIQNVPTGYCGVNITNPGDYITIHKVSFVDCDTSMKVSANDANPDNQIYLEYVDATQDATTSKAFEFISVAGTPLSISCENFYVYGVSTLGNPPIGVLASGTGLDLSFRAASLVGTDGNGIGLEILDGSKVSLPVLGISNWATGISVPQVGSAPDLQIFATAFGGNTSYNLDLQHSGLTGFSTAYSPFALNNINVANDFFFSNKDRKIVVVAKKGGDFATVHEALTAISGLTSSTDIYTVQINPGIYNEPAMIIPPYTSIEGNNMEGVIISPSGNYDLFTFSNKSEMSFITIFGNGYSASSSAIVGNDLGSYTTLHKVYVDDFNKGMTFTNSTSGVASYVYLEYCSVQTQNVGLPSYAISVNSNNGGIDSVLSVDIQNLTIYSYDQDPSDFIFINGKDTTCLLKTFSIQGVNGSGNGLTIQNGICNVDASNGGIEYTNNAIYAPQIGAGSDIKLAAITFDSNSGLDINIEHSGTTGYSSIVTPYLKTFIEPASSFYIVNKDQHEITVAYKGGDFTSIAAACNSISGNSSTNRYVVSIGPGEFFEPQIVVPSYTYLRGSTINATVITPSGGWNAIKMSNLTEASFLTVQNVPSPYYAFDFTGCGDFAQLHKVSMYNSNGIKMNTTVGNNDIAYVEYVDINGPYDNAVNITSVSGSSSYMNCENFYCYQYSSPSGTTDAYVSGPGAELEIKTSAFAGNASGTGRGLYVGDEGRLNLSSMTVKDYQYGIYIDDTGSVPTIGPDLEISNVTVVNSTVYDYYVKHQYANGVIAGIAEKEFIYVNPLNTSISWSIQDPTGEVILGGDLYLGKQFDKVQFTSPLIMNTTTMGLVHGGELIVLPPASGLNVHVNAGYGYVDTDPTDWTKTQYVEWTQQNLAVSSNSVEYIYVDYDGIIKKTITSINGDVSKILLGQTTTNPTFLSSVEKISVEATHFSNKADEYLRDVFGGIVADGLVIGFSGLNLSATEGEYYYSSHKWAPTDKFPIPRLLEFYHSGSSFTAQTNTSGIVNNTQWDNGVNLSGLTTGYYTKHGLYYAGDSDMHMFVYGTTQHSGLTACQTSSTPMAPPSFTDAIIPVADIIVQQGSGSVIQVYDTRPTPSYKATSTSTGGGVTVHSQLLGLTVGNDHTQYLLANGTTPVGGDLNLTNNNINNVNLINGINISGHASQHLPNGFDSLTTAAPLVKLNLDDTNYAGVQNSLARSDQKHAFDIGVPVTISALTNSSGISSNFIRADHLHAHGVQSDSTLHTVASAIANGFMSSGNFTSLSTAIQSGTNLDGGTAIFSGKSGTNLEFKSIIGSGMTVSSDASRVYLSVDDLYVNTSGDSMTGTLNVPTLSGTTISGNNIYRQGVELFVTSGTTPISVNNGLVSILSGSSVQNGYISSGDWVNFNSKQASGNYIVSGSSTILNNLNVSTLSGTTISGLTIYENGIQVVNSGVGTGNVTVTKTNGTLNISGNALTTANVAENSSFLYYTDTRARAVISGTSPITVSNGLIGITTASSVSSGSLTSTDWNTFNTGATNSSTALGQISSLSGTVANHTTYISNVSGVAASAVQTISTSGTGTTLVSARVANIQYVNSLSGLGGVTITGPTNGVVSISGASNWSGGTVTSSITPSISGTLTLGTQALPFSGAYIQNLYGQQTIIMTYNEVPVGNINSSNKTFTLLNAPARNSSQLFYNGSYQKLSTDYTISGITITMAVAPYNGSDLVCNYGYSPY